MSKKLELTWIGKEDAIEVEPRLLIENPELSNTTKDPNTENMIIHGDNLLALKALEAKYACQVKCIYIDPPYNTGAAFEHYDDNLEHSIWLGLMRERLLLLKSLLSSNGIIFVQIDAVEVAYLRIVMDEIFGRKNFVNMISVKTKVAGVSGSNMGKSLQDNVEYVLVYAKDKSLIQLNTVYTTQKLSSRIQQYQLEGKSWKYTSVMVNLSDRVLLAEIPDKGMKIYGYKKLETMSITQFANTMNITEAEVYNSYADKIFQTTNAQSSVRATVMEITADMTYPMIGLVYTPIKGKNEGKEIEVLYKGDQRRMMMFLSDSVNKIDGEYYYLDKVNSLWDDFQYNNLTKEGSVKFPNGKKPETLLQRVLELTTNTNDLVLDSFLGSGTTIAVAHKMGRKYIGIEMGEHAYTHDKVRLDKVIDGTDQGGISKDINWQGGGGYRFYELAPTLIQKDDFDEEIINPEYDANMLASAVALHEGFTYQPDEEQFWKQAYGSENSYLFVTTRYVSKEHLSAIHSNMAGTDYLIIACRSFEDGVEKQYPNITVKKIPQMLLDRCEFGKENYNLNIINPPVYEEDDNDEE